MDLLQISCAISTVIDSLLLRVDKNNTNKFVIRKHISQWK